MIINFSLIDIIIMLVIIAAAIRGAIKGFVAEAASMAAIIFGIGICIMIASWFELIAEGISN